MSIFKDFDRFSSYWIGTFHFLYFLLNTDINNVLNIKLDFSHFLFTVHCAMPEDLHRIYFPALSRSSAPGRVFYIPFNFLPALVPGHIFTSITSLYFEQKSDRKEDTPVSSKGKYYTFILFGNMRTKRSTCWEFDLQCQHRISVVLVCIVETIYNNKI